MKKLVAYIMCIILTITCVCTIANAEETWHIGSATWQDPNNIVLIWEAPEGDSFEVYRAEQLDGDYQLIGTTGLGSYRDDTVRHPDTYYYKIKNSNTGAFSLPVVSGYNPRKVSSVIVIMYHNFVTEKDIADGVAFDEYSLKPEDFESDLIWLRDNGFVTITSDDLIKYLDGSKSLPEKAVIISIDDGTMGVYTHAWPLFKKYNMKADFNVIGKQIDTTWEKLHDGGTRTGEEAPYCTWEELIEMQVSGEINICSHTYGMHVYNEDKRIGMSMMTGETDEDYIAAIKRDYDLSRSCIEGWTGEKPRTVAYPYSKRSAMTDKLILGNTDYQILMAGRGDRGTSANYFVEGCDLEHQLTLMSRPCRMDGTPIGKYVEDIYENDCNNGVNKKPDIPALSKEKSARIAADYIVFDDVDGSAWFSGPVYYSYVNGLMKGTSYSDFAPSRNINRAMAATLLHRFAGMPEDDNAMTCSDIETDSWYSDAAAWASVKEVMQTFPDGSFRPYEAISREELARSIYQCVKLIGMDCDDFADISHYTDSGSINPENTEAMQWAVASGIYQGGGDGTINPKGNVTRAEMAAILQNYLNKFTMKAGDVLQ